jgi:hypothetical protein
VKRILCAAPIIALALLPVTAAADYTPSPSLDQILLAPPLGYTEHTLTTYPHGRFTIHDFALTYGPKIAEVEIVMQQDGFVDGFSTLWINKVTRRGMIEYVMAFSGGKGARSFLSYMNIASKQSSTYKHANSITGIDPYWGEHEVTASGVVSDSFAFVKGNDLFVMGFVSTRDDVLDLTTAYAKNLYNAAPASTILPADWPENGGTGNNREPALAVGGLLVFVLVIAFIAGLIGLTAILVGRRQQHKPAAERLTSDRRYWWDGQYWKDTLLEAPPAAKRSVDGHFWWDGAEWRPVP